MADMANLDQTIECWDQLRRLCPDQTIVPVTYMNSSAAIKAFVGEHGGAVCTSSNCRNVLKWALKGGADKPGGEQNQSSVFPRSASRPQYRIRDGLSAGLHGGLGSDAEISAATIRHA